MSKPAFSIDKKNKTIVLPNGYNGHVVICALSPIEIKDGIVKLPVVNSTYLFQLVYTDKLIRALIENL